MSFSISEKNGFTNLKLLLFNVYHEILYRKYNFDITREPVMLRRSKRMKPFIPKSCLHVGYWSLPPLKPPTGQLATSLRLDYTNCHSSEYVFYEKYICSFFNMITVQYLKSNCWNLEPLYPSLVKTCCCRMRDNTTGILKERLSGGPTDASRTNGVELLNAHRQQQS